MTAALGLRPARTRPPCFSKLPRAIRSRSACLLLGLEQPLQASVPNLGGTADWAGFRLGHSEAHDPFAPTGHDHSDQPIAAHARHLRLLHHHALARHVGTLSTPRLARNGRSIPVRATEPRRRSALLRPGDFRREVSWRWDSKPTVRASPLVLRRSAAGLLLGRLRQPSRRGTAAARRPPPSPVVVRPAAGRAAPCRLKLPAEAARRRPTTETPR